MGSPDAREYAVLNGELIAIGIAGLHVSERGFLHGEGLFETIRMEAQVLVGLDVHLARLAASCRALGLPSPPDARVIAEDACKLLGRYGPDGLVRLTWSAGPALGAGPDDPSLSPTRLLTRRPGVGSVPLTLVPVVYRPGEHAAHKTTARWPYQRARAAARAQGYDDALLIDGDGSVLETTTAALVVAWGEERATPEADGRILPGIGRAALVAGGHRIVERRIAIAELARADAAWIVGAASARPRPVAFIGERRLTPRAWPD